MIEGLKPYAEYKESGQKWLGGVPAHWDLKPGHAAFGKRKESNRGMKEKTVLSLSYGRIKVKATDKQHGLVPESYETYQVVNEGNVIIRGTDLQNDHTSLRIGLSRNRGIISSAYLCLQALPSITPDYGYQILNVFDLTKAIYRYGSGLRQNLDHGEIKRLPIFLPPLDEQAAIVRFLDHANRKIDGFIRAKRKLIGLLNEQKQAIIHRAVTRGLHPDAPLKPSGIPWLGDIPVSWTVAKLKHLTRFQNGLPFKPADWKAEGIPIIRIQNLNGSDDFNYTIKNTLPTDLLIRNGDLMFAWSGNKGTSFGSFQWDRPFDGYLNQHIFKLTGFKIPRRYFYYVLRAVTRHVEEQAGGIIGLVHVTKPELGSVQVPIASAEEQENIAQYIDVATAALTTVIARTDREIALMQEYRTRLTADLVTGKLDVRAAAAHLPAPDEPLEEIETELEETNDANN